MSMLQPSSPAVSQATKADALLQGRASALKDALASRQDAAQRLRALQQRILDRVTPARG